MTHELSPATNPAYIQTALREALQQPDLELRDLELLRHKPGRRALIAYTIARPGQPPQTLLGKQRVKGVDKHGYHIQRALWQQGFDLPGLAVIVDGRGVLDPARWEGVTYRSIGNGTLR